jgi:dipeptidyl aminopeptidase/acylaminoacyl peptidase
VIVLRALREHRQGRRVLAAVAVLALAAGATAWGRNETRTSARLAELVRALGDQYPDPVSVSPDGQTVLLKYLDATQFELRLVRRSDGTEIGRLRDRNRQLSPRWRPDSRAIAFFSDEDGNQQYHLYVYHIADGRLTKLPAAVTSALTAAWSPDGSRIAYVVEPYGGVKTLTVVRADGQDSSMVVADHLSRHAGLAWAPDGQSLVTTIAGDEGAVRIVALGGGQTRVPVAEDGEVRGLVWPTASGAIWAMVRSPASNRTRLVAVDPATARVSATIDEDGEIGALAAMGTSFTYQVNTDGEARAMLVPASSIARRRRIGPLEGSTALLGLSSRGDTVFAAHTARLSPPRFAEIPLQSGDLRERAFATTPRALSTGTRIDLRATDGYVTPAYLWRAPTATREERVLILVHGGPRLQTMRTWDAGIQQAVREGMSVIAVNYRGSSGYGIAHEERASDLRGQIADVRAAADYARGVLGIPPDRTVIWGHSYGALLVARLAAASPDLAGRVVLISLVADDDAARALSRTHPDVYLFHGENDVEARPAVAIAQARRVFGSSLFRDRVHVRVIPQEGHSFRRLESWARVYELALRAQ